MNVKIISVLVIVDIEAKSINIVILKKSKAKDTFKSEETKNDVIT